MSNKCVRISLLLLLLLVAVQNAGAQFYKQNDSIARIIKAGVVRRQPSLAVADKGGKKAGEKSTEKRKTKRSAKKQKGQSAAKVVERKGTVEYTGRKYRLGERIIMRGDSGSDVKSVARILVRKLFLDEKDIIYTADGGVLYEGEIVRAVRLFQKVHGMYDDGMVGATTLKALRRRD